VVVAGGRATALVTADGDRIDAGCVVLAAGAYFSPAVLLRSGIGPAGDLRGLGIDVVADLPVGSVLLDHHGTGIGWAASEALAAGAAQHEAEHGPLFEPGVVVKAASASCPGGSWDLHLVPWLNTTPGDPRACEPTVAVFHMKPLSTGRLRLRSTAPDALPLVERGLLANEGDLDVIVEGVEVARAIAASDPLRSLLGPETRPGRARVEQYVRATMRNYFHPAGTCPIGSVVDERCRVLGVDGLVVADASIMPTIPRANTNVTAVAIAERVAEML
jgi:choline dehydrogenase